MTASERDADREIARRLRTTWDPFFSRFSSLREIQRLGIPAILRGENVLLCAPTSSGKTEAACAPILDRKLSTDPGSMVLYISPTRALANDLFHRLDVPCRQANRLVVRRTGEYSYAPALRQADIVITTPESFDSMLCRGMKNAQGGPHVLARVSTVVLDEVHLLFGTARGHQVEWLLNRLRRLRQFAVGKGWTSSTDLQIVALSATVSDPNKIVSTFLPDGTIVQVDGVRDIELVGNSATNLSLSRATETELPEYIRSLDHSEKFLVFCNQRARVDRLTNKLAEQLEGTGYRVESHHGSLDKAVREHTEGEARLRERIVVVASSTLEIGIDIGDIDVVVLDAPPPDIASLLQRIGRGNRRASITRVMLCWRSRYERAVAHAMIEAAEVGWLGPVHSGPQFAVARQQIASFTFQSPNLRRKRASLIELVDSIEGNDVGGALVQAMVSDGELKVRESETVLCQFWLNEAEYGRIHSTIDDMGGSQVVDRESGRSIAHNIKSVGNKGLQAAGRNFNVTGRSEYRYEVSDAGKTSMAGEAWEYAAGAILNSAGPCQALRRSLSIPEHEWPAIFIDSNWFAFHFGGSLMDGALDLAAASNGRTGNANQWFIQLGPTPDLPNWCRNASEVSMHALIESRLPALERLLARPRSNKKLPVALRVREISEWLELGERASEMRAARIRTRNDPAIVEILTSIIRDSK